MDKYLNNTKLSYFEERLGKRNIMPYHKLLQELLVVLPNIPISEFKPGINMLSKHKLCELSKIVSDVRKQKYKRNRETLYGNLPRCFSNIQLYTLFGYIDHTPTKRYLLLMFFYSLRVSEVPLIEVVSDQRLLKIHNLKCSRIEYLPIIDGTEKLFWNLNETIKLSSDVVRNRFRRACEASGLNYAYGVDSKGKYRHQFSTHSLRHTGINIFAAYIKDQYKAMIYSRHSNRSLGTISTYRHYSLEELRKDLNKCFFNYTL